MSGTANTFMPKVSIVIPVYNGADYLADAIDSALAQDYDNKEIIVVNDGSTDDGATEAIVSDYGTKLRYFFKPNGHVASALNYAIERMTGEYFSWLSHDDLYFPNKVSAQVAQLAGEPTNTIIYSDFEVLDVAGGCRCDVRLSSPTPDGFRLWITANNSLHGCSLLIPRSAFEECGRFNETLRTTQDYDMWFRMSARYRFIHLPRVLVTARQHAGQGSRQLGKLAQRECDDLLAEFVDDLSAVDMGCGEGYRLPVAFAALSENLRRRGFDRAAGAALQRARESVSGGWISRLVGNTCLAASALGGLLVGGLQRGRMMGSNKLKLGIQRLRELLRPGGGRVREKFVAIYRENVFGSDESRSGAGSTMEQTATLRVALPALLGELGARSLIDAPCGDFNWMRHTPLNLDSYIGIDIVEELIRTDQEMYGSPKREFLCRDIIADPLPTAEVILCRDCLVHLTFDQASKAISNFKRSGSTYLLTTTFSERDANVDLKGKDIWRTLNLERAPFNFPPPLRLVNENCTEGDGAYGDKCLGLWRLADLPA